MVVGIIYQFHKEKIMQLKPIRFQVVESSHNGKSTFQVYDNALESVRPAHYMSRERAELTVKNLNEYYMQDTVMTFTDKKGKSYKKNILTGKKV
jgi:hypothetical protein